MLKSATEEKESCAERCKDLLERERAEAEERELNMRQEFSTKLNELEEQYNGLREHVEREGIEHFGPENVVSEGSDRPRGERSDHFQKLWEEIECLRTEKGELERELEAERKTAKVNF